MDNNAQIETFQRIASGEHSDENLSLNGGSEDECYSSTGMLSPDPMRQLLMLSSRPQGESTSRNELLERDSLPDGGSATELVTEEDIFDPSEHSFSNTARSWFGTLNRPEDETRSLEFEAAVARLNELENEAESGSGRLVYLMYVQEHGSRNNREHYHAVLHFNSPIRRTAVKSYLRCEFWNLFPRRGSIDDCRRYLEKGGAPIRTAGRKPRERNADAKKRKAEKEYKEFIEDAYNLEISMVDLLMKHKRRMLSKISAVAKIRSYLLPERKGKPYVLWVRGDTGVGKSRGPFETFKGMIYRKNTKNKWWDGYDPTVHHVVIVDDYRAMGDLDFTWFLSITDWYHVSEEVKGGATYPSPALLIFTTPWRVEIGLSHPDESIDQALRRIDKQFELPEQLGEYNIFLQEFKEGKHQKPGYQPWPLPNLEISTS
jgi:hypothetical protein